MSVQNQWRGPLYSLAVIFFVRLSVCPFALLQAGRQTDTLKSLAAPLFYILSHFGKALLNGQVPFFC